MRQALLILSLSYFWIFMHFKVIYALNLSFSQDIYDAYYNIILQTIEWKEWKNICTFQTELLEPMSLDKYIVWWMQNLWNKGRVHSSRDLARIHQLMYVVFLLGGVRLCIFAGLVDMK